MEIKVFTNEKLFMTNAFLVINNRSAILIDVAGKEKEITAYLKKHELHLTNILITHSHFNHIKGIDKIKTTFPSVKIVIGQKDIVGLYDQKSNKSLACEEGFSLKKEVRDLIPISKDSLINLSGIEFKIITGGGCTRGSLVYKMTNNDMIFCGDELYLDQITNPSSIVKKTNLRKSKRLIKYIYNSVSNNYKFYPGHGEVGFTLAELKAKNLAANVLIKYKPLVENNTMNS